LGEPIIYNCTDQPEKVLTLKDIFPEPAKKKGKKKKKKKGGAKKKVVPYKRPQWAKYDTLRSKKLEYEKELSNEFSSLTSKQFELSLMKDSTIPPVIDDKRNDPAKREVDLLIDSAVNS